MMLTFRAGHHPVDRRCYLRGVRCLARLLGNCAWLLWMLSTAALADSHRNLRLVPHALPNAIGDAAVRDLVEDNNAYLWIATDRGLLRFDGSQHQLFDYSRSAPLRISGDDVRDLLLLRNGDLLVATSGGVDRFVQSQQLFVPLSTDPPVSAASGGVRFVLEDQQGAIWIAQDSGTLVQRHPGTDGGSRTFHAGEAGLPEPPITALLEDQRGNLWVGTDAGLFRFDPRDNRFLDFTPDSAARVRVRALYEDSRERLWIGTADGSLLRLDPDRLEVQHLEPALDSATPGPIAINDLWMDHAGTLWLATSAGLVERNENDEFQQYQSATAQWRLPDAALAALYQDRDQVLWIAGARGLARWNFASDTFRFVDPPTEDDRVTALTEMPDGSLWYATERGALFGIDRQGRPQTDARPWAQVLPEDRVTTLRSDDRGRLWIGYEQRGLATVDLETASARRIALADETVDYPVSALAIDGSGLAVPRRLWVAISGRGLFGLPLVATAADEGLPELRPVTLPDPAVDSRGITSLAVVANGVLWFGTDDGRVSAFDRALGELTTAAQGTERAAPITSLLESTTGDLWITTDGAGALVLPNAESFADQPPPRRFTTVDGLSSNHLTAAIEDSGGMLWLAGTRGLTRFDPERLQATGYGEPEGLRSARFQHAAALSTRAGALVFGSDRGLLMFFPTALARKPEAPRLQLSVWHGDRFVGSAAADPQGAPPVAAGDSGIEFAAGVEEVRFRFASLNSRDPGAFRFLVKLDGLDSTWIDPQLDRQRRYTNLPSGSYRFLVRGYDPSDPAAHTERSISFRVHEPLWRSTPALCAYALGALLLLLWLARVWLQGRSRLKLAQRNLEIEVEARTVELEERNQQLQELNARLQEASITDPLTGLLNRRSFYEFVSREVARIERGYTAALASSSKAGAAPRTFLFFMMIDLDEFKPINDTFGHHTGDHTLVQVSDLLRACAREADTVFRWGGDEFLVVGEARDPADMNVLAERFRKTIADHRFDPKYGKALRLSASIGVAAYPYCATNPGIASWEQVADIADLSALLAKTHGKNGWVSSYGTGELTATQMQRIKNNFELLIEAGRIVAVTSDMDVPIKGAFRQS
ncbi:MAG: two-component regulator propeller domain-containing protein [Pseudomonadota bacterium]